MPRRKLSEYRSKILVNGWLGLEYQGVGVVTGAKKVTVRGRSPFVVKVDQAVKGRFKKGLVLLGVKKTGINDALRRLEEQGYESFLIEPEVAHKGDEERYMALNLERDGLKFSWSEKGGVDIEAHPESIHSVLIDKETDWPALATGTGLSEGQLQILRDKFQQNYLSFMEINPYVVTSETVKILDCAIEVDDAGEYFTHEWTEADIRSPKAGVLTLEEKQVRQLDAKSPASFNLSVLNPDGGVFLLLSGGGASVVAADEVYNQGFGKELANYGEYSGNPNQDEAEQYTRAVLSLLLHSKSKKKVLFIGGAVANFTDIANTFTGVIAAIDAVADQLHEQGVKVFVRRGGPRQEIGLAKIEACLQRHNILGSVHTPETPLTEVVGLALQEVK